MHPKILASMAAPLLCCAALHAQPNPEIQPLTPAGVTIGKATEIAINGTNLQEATGVLASFPGKFKFTQDKKTEATQIKVSIEPDAGLPPSLQIIRISTTRGISGARVIALDKLPVVAENGQNTSKEKAQEVTLPCVVDGKIDAETARWFRFKAKKGQAVSFETIGRRLGSNLDPQLTLYDAKGKELQGGYSNDSPGLQTDARIRYEFKEEGSFLLALRDVSWRGGADFLYRLRIGDFPMATTPFPLAVETGKPGTVGFAGPSTAAGLSAKVNAAGKPVGDTMLVGATLPGGGDPGMAVELPVSAIAEVEKSGNNHQLAQAQPITIPSAVNGRLLKRGERDYYKFAAKKGAKIAIDGTGSGPFSPTEVYLEILDAKGGKIQKSDPGGVPVLEFTPPADGDFTLMVEHVHLWGGPTEAYRIVLQPPQPRVNITLAQDRYAINQGGEVGIPILVERKGYDEAFKVVVVSPAGLQGTLEIPKGKPAKPADPAGTIVVKAPPTLPMGPQPLVLALEGKVAHSFSVAKPVSTGLAGLPYLPHQFGSSAAVAILEKPPFKVESTLVEKTAKIGQKATIKAKVVRDKGFEGAIAVSVEGLPKEVTATTASIAPNASEVDLVVTLGAKAEVGKPNLKVTGKSTKGAREFVVSSGGHELQIQK